MKILKLRHIWSSVDDLNVSNNGKITNTGIENYWRSIDEAIQFWENGRNNRKRMKLVDSGREFVRRANLDHHEFLTGRCRRRDESPDRQGRADQHREVARMLPKPPPRF